tara:strand:- start:74 stop:499 length:426 start_codon:yes stop_codon:yes gene_type:complete
MKGFSGFKSSPAKQVTREQRLTDSSQSAPADATPRELYKKHKTTKKPQKAPEKQASPAKQEGPISKKNIKLQKGEMEGTWIYPGGDKSERMIDYEERAGFLKDNDITNDGSKEDNQRIKTAKKLQHEADIIRNRKPKKKKK